MTEQPLPAPTIDLDKAKSHMATFGYCIVQDALNPDEVQEVRTRFLEQVAAEEERGLAHNLPDKKQLVFFLINKGRVFTDMILNPALHEIVKSVLGDEYLLSSFNGHIAHPGGYENFHTDQFWMPPPTTPDKRTLVRPGSVTRVGNRGKHVGGEELLSQRTISPAVVCNAMWLLDDFTPDNGATIVVPKSHLSGRQPDGSMDAEANWVPAVGPAGSAVIFEGRTWHSTGINRTDKTRIGLTTNFCGPQFRQQENLQLGTRPEVLASMNDMQKKLLGFKPWQGYGGYEYSGEWVNRETYTVGELKPTN